MTVASVETIKRLIAKIENINNSKYLWQRLN